MKKTLLTMAMLLALTASSATAQDRIAYANLDLVLAMMPESQVVSQQLDEYRKTLEGELMAKQAQLQQKYTEAQEAAAAGVASEEKLEGYRNELHALDLEIQRQAAEADQKLLVRRSELLEPVIEKLQTTIEGVAKRDGFTHVLNSLDGSGTSVVLWGLEERDITKSLMTELGIEVPEDTAP